MVESGREFAILNDNSILLNNTVHKFFNEIVVII